jgi:hypothetical protein
MRRIFACLSAVVFILGFGLAADAIHETATAETQLVLPGPDAKKLNDYITRDDPYRDWGMWPGKGKLYKGTEPHGALLTTFINKAASYSINKKEGLADGSIIVKENYTADKQFIALTVMYKIAGYNPGGGDWFWVKYSSAGKVEASGKVQVCIDCHSKQKDNDYLFTGKVK